MTELEHPHESPHRPEPHGPSVPTPSGGLPAASGPRVLDQSRHSSAFWRRLAYWGARYGPPSLLRYSPPVLGTFSAALLGDTREVVRQNLRRVLGTRSSWVEYTDVVRTFANYASCLAEALGAERTDTKAVARRVSGAEHLMAALEGRGALLATAHLGAWDAAARWLPELARGREVVVVMTSEADAEARRVNDTVRERIGVRVVHSDQHPLNALGLLGDLRRGSIVCMQLDRVPEGVRAVPVRLFEAPFRVPQGPFTLAALAGVSVLPLFVGRVGFLRYDVDIGPPIDIPPRPSRVELVRAAQRATDEMERFIRAHPTQWFHFHGE
ncbi:MAG: lysophospholipid acyltransferase family protein [Polyangiaceae bacterium]|nr:lysophospholipid acyltransferase family protein [Polyangiaceae bacterium]